GAASPTTTTFSCKVAEITKPKASVSVTMAMRRSRCEPELSMERLKYKFNEFSGPWFASGRVDAMLITRKAKFSAPPICPNPALSDEQNRAAFGAAANPHGHGHNYVLEVTLEASLTGLPAW